jgi:hypothetical protein
VPGNALPGWPSRVELAEGLAAGIIPGLLPGIDKGQRGVAMIELSKMLVEGFSQHLREALPHEQPSPLPFPWCL